MNEGEIFKASNDDDRVKLWFFIRNRVSPSTTTGATGFKENLGKTNIKTFDNDIKAFNAWFKK